MAVIRRFLAIGFFLGLGWGGPALAADCAGAERIDLTRPVEVSAQERAQLAALPPLRVLAVSTPPLSLYHDDKQVYTGVAIDALCFITQALGLRYSIDPAPQWKVQEKIESIQNGEADIFLPLSPTPERSTHGRFTQALYTSYYVAIARKGRLPEIAQTADLARYRLGIVHGVALEPMARALASDPHPLRSYRESFAQGGLFDGLRQGEIDIALFSRDFFLEQRYNHELFDLEVVHAFKEYPRHYGFYIGQRPELALLADVFNRYLAAMDSSASLQAHQIGERQMIERYLQQRTERTQLQAGSIAAALLALTALLALRYHRRLWRDLAASNRQIIAQQQALQTANAQLEKLSLTDGLTGLANRRAFDAALQRETTRQGRSASPLSLLMLDLDFFKTVNDRYGHACGDDYLRAVAQVLQQHCAPPTDLAARYGGEEFICLLPDTPAAVAQQRAEAIRSAVAALQRPSAGSPFGVLTLSIGVITLTQAAPDIQTLLTLADTQLYAAKAAGRNAVCSQVL